MLACTALVGCSDDVIDNIAQDNNELKSDAKGYLTISISSTTNSSRGLMDNAKGDGDGDAESSGHYNAGTEKENKVNSILVVIKNNENIQYAKLYGPTDTNTSYSIEDDFTVTNKGQFYTMKEPFEVELGTYTPLVVINPNGGVKGLMSTNGVSVDPTTGVVTGDLYKAICDYSVNPVAATRNAATFAEAQQLVAGTNYDNFMMANRTSEATITVTTANTGKDNAAGMDTFIEVERAISKITFRPTSLTGESFTNQVNTKNLYKVPFTHYQIQGESTQINETTYVKYITADDKFVWSSDGGNTFYTIEGQTATQVPTDQTVDGYIDTTDAEVYYVRSEEPVETNWYVKLERYAMTNLSTDLYAVRHVGYTNNAITPMKVIGTNEYLVDPFSTDKNNVQWTNDGGWNGTYNYNDWFFNSWDKVQGTIESKSNYNLDVDWTNLNGNLDNPQDVTGDVHENYGEEASTVGEHLVYCFENAVKQLNSQKKDLQTAGLSTAIVFEGKIYEKDASGNLIDLTTPLYQYQGSLFTSVEDIKTLHGHAEWNVTDESEASELEAKGIKVYKGGKCYYYTSQIKHFDDGNNQTNGVMEFAIMRNNIYSIAVTGIKTIGDADLSGFTPAEPDESATAYIQVNAKILPWIVRFTDVEF